MVLPTGFGKSACYQIPSMILPKPVLVVSPLLALMRDQSQKLAALGVPCVRLDGTVRGKERAAALARVAAGGSLLVLTTPESLFNERGGRGARASRASRSPRSTRRTASPSGATTSAPPTCSSASASAPSGAPPILALTATATAEGARRGAALPRHARTRSSSRARRTARTSPSTCCAAARARGSGRCCASRSACGARASSTARRRREVDEIYAILQRFGIPSHRYHGKMTRRSAARTRTASCAAAAAP